MEGPTDDPEILQMRAREQRNMIATLLLSQGVPMLLHGDEMSRTQDGNNNTYAQDSEISWSTGTAPTSRSSSSRPRWPTSARATRRSTEALHRQHRAHRRWRAPQRRGWRWTAS